MSKKVLFPNLEGVCVLSEEQATKAITPQLDCVKTLKENCYHIFTPIIGAANNPHNPSKPITFIIVLSIEKDFQTVYFEQLMLSATSIRYVPFKGVKPDPRKSGVYPFGNFIAINNWTMLTDWFNTVVFKSGATVEVVGKPSNANWSVDDLFTRVDDDFESLTNYKHGLTSLLTYEKASETEMATLFTAIPKDELIKDVKDYFGALVSGNKLHPKTMDIIQKQINLLR